MELKEISKDIYDIDAWLDESLGKEGTSEREKNRERAWEEYNAQILLDARKNAGLTQQELADRIGANKGYISRIERGLTVPTVATLYKIASAMGLTIELRRYLRTISVKQNLIKNDIFPRLRAGIFYLRALLDRYFIPIIKYVKGVFYPF